MNSTKLQTTLTGFTAWAVGKLAARKGKTQAEIASYLLERFVDANLDYFEQFEITVHRFESENMGGSVVPMERSKT